MVGKPEELAPLKERLQQADGILAIHLTLPTLPVMKELLKLGRPTMVFSAPYSGHEWFYLSDLRRSELGRKLECVLTTDFRELAAAIRPFRALHHLRLAGWFDAASGILVGRTAAEVVESFTQRDALVDALDGLTIPVIYDMDIGHLPPQLMLVNGARATLSFGPAGNSVTQTLA